MSSEDRVEFPKWINRPARLIGIEQDEVFLLVGTLMGTLIITFLFRLGTPTIIMATVIIPLISYKVYKWYKEEQTKGALYYFLYERNLIRPKESPDEFIDCEKVTSVIPIGYEQYFRN